MLNLPYLLTYFLPRRNLLDVICKQNYFIHFCVVFVIAPLELKFQLPIEANHLLVYNILQYVFITRTFTVSQLTHCPHWLLVCTNHAPATPAAPSSVRTMHLPF